MSETPGIHDRFFKSRFSQIENMEGLLRGFLPETLSTSIDYETLEYLDTEKIGLSYEKSHLDLVLSACFAGSKVQIYLLFEHKSTHDPTIFLQLLRYMVALWHMDQENDRKPTVVLPFVVYHGSTRWHYPERFQEFCAVPDFMKPYALDFSPLVLDAGRISDEEIQKRAGHLGTAATLIAIKHIFDKTYQEYTIALEPMGADLDVRTFESVLEYFLIYRGIEDPDLARIIGEALNRREDMPNVIEKWMEAGREEGLKEGIQKGLEEGLEKGLEKGLQKSIEKFLLKTRLTPAEIASTLDVDLSWVLEIEKNLEKPSEDSAR